MRKRNYLQRKRIIETPKIIKPRATDLLGRASRDEDKVPVEK